MSYQLLILPSAEKEIKQLLPNIKTKLFYGVRAGAD